MTEPRPDTPDCASPPCLAHELDPLWSGRAGYAVPLRAPVRAEHSYVQRLCATPAQVLPLLCPVRETDWIVDWRPQYVISASGLAEPDCVFATPAPAGGSALWYVTRHDALQGYVEMVRFVPEHTACRLEIWLQADGDSACLATVRYRLTSLGSVAGDAAVAAYTAEHYLAFMRDWERRLNHWLRTGRCLPAD